jgi:acyl-CoA synthetase (AMP-forming)/AMP-acid ligase II
LNTQQNKVAIVINEPSQLEIVLAWSFGQSNPFLIVDSARMDKGVSSHLHQLGFQIISDTSLLQNNLGTGSPESLFVMTSGTTGLPKIVKHAISSLNTFGNVNQLEPSTWFVPAPIGSFAWYQMIFLRRQVEHQELILTNSNDLILDFENAIKKKAFSAISCTPTFLRYVSTIFDQDLFKHSSVKRITLGGEVIQDSDLKLASSLFPNVKINHIYAATEFGPVFTSNEQAAGYSLSKYRNNIDFKIVEGMLFVKNRMESNPHQWVETGDYAVCENERIYILGRISQDFINVGGNRVSLKKVEEVILQIPEIQWVKAYGINSRLMGNVVGVNVAIKDISLKEQIEMIINSHCLEFLTDFEIPCEIFISEDIQINKSLKK